MRLDSVRAFKAEVSAGVIAEDGDGDAVRSFYESTEPPMPRGVALGVTRSAPGEYLVAIRTSDRKKAEQLSSMAKGEADVRIVRVEKRATAQEIAYLQARRRPLEPGCQVAMDGKRFVGTLGCFVRDNAGVLYVLSNCHVLADEGRSAPGWRIGQPFGSASDIVATLTRFVPLSDLTPNLVDCAIARVDKTPAFKTLNIAIGGDITGWVDIAPSDLGLKLHKAGRSTGSTAGVVTAVEIDGLGVRYDRGLLRFNDQIEVSGGVSSDFSAPGDSGSAVVDDQGRVRGLLFAGGRDSLGEDRTYLNRIGNVLGALGVHLALD